MASGFDRSVRSERDLASLLSFVSTSSFLSGNQVSFALNEVMGDRLILLALQAYR